MKTLYLVRHGEAGDERIESVTYRPQNEYDKPLTEAGIKQASLCAAVFRGMTFDRAYTSDYLRAVETYEQLNVNTASYEALSDIRELYCECIGRNFGNTDLAEFEEQKTRVERFIAQQLNTMKEDETVLVVAHGCFILYLLYRLTGKSFGHEMSYTGVTKLVYNTQWDFEFFNDSEHLYKPVDPAIKKLMQPA